MDVKFSIMMKRIRDTHAEEVDCSACLDQISQYVDIELSGGDAPGRLPKIKHHLEQCSVCLDEYQVLRELARLERDGELPSNEDLIDRLK